MSAANTLGNSVFSDHDNFMDFPPFLVTEQQISEKLKNIMKENADLVQKLSSYEQKVLFFHFLSPSVVLSYFLLSYSSVITVFLNHSFKFHYLLQTLQI